MTARNKTQTANYKGTDFSPHSTFPPPTETLFHIYNETNSPLTVYVQTKRERPEGRSLHLFQNYLTIKE